MKSKLLALALVSLSAACTGGEPVVDDSPEPLEYSRVVSDDAPYLIEWRPTEGRVPQNEPFDLEVRVLDKLTAEPIGDVELRVDAGMPHHGHGMNVVPVHTPTGEGVWLSEGLLFHMGGEWTLTFDVTDGGVTERLQCVVSL